MEAMKQELTRNRWFTEGTAAGGLKGSEVWPQSQGTEAFSIGMWSGRAVCGHSALGVFPG